MHPHTTLELNNLKRFYHLINSIRDHYQQINNKKAESGRVDKLQTRIVLVTLQFYYVFDSFPTRELTNSIIVVVKYTQLNVNIIKKEALYSLYLYTISVAHQHFIMFLSLQVLHSTNINLLLFFIRNIYID